MKRTLSKRLKAARMKQGLSIRDVARLSRGAISNPYVSQLENGVMLNPHPDKLRVLAKILRLDYLTLMMTVGYVTAEELGLK